MDPRIYARWREVESRCERKEDRSQLEEGKALDLTLGAFPHKFTNKLSEMITLAA